MKANSCNTNDDCSDLCFHIEDINSTDFIEEDSNDITELLSIINMYIQINVYEQSEANEVISILNQKNGLSKYHPKSSTRINHYPNAKPRKISMAG